AEAKALEEAGDFLGAYAKTQALGPRLRSQHREELTPYEDSLQASAITQASARADELAEQGDFDGAIAELAQTTRVLRGAHRSQALRLARDLRKRKFRSQQQGGQPTAKPSAKPSPSPRPTRRPDPVRPPEPKPTAHAAATPTPRRRYRPWEPRYAGSDEELLHGMPANATIKRTEHFVVISTADEEFTRTSANMLETVRRGFYRFFERKDFQLRQPEGLLIAYVFGSREDYERYVKSKGIGISPQAAGFYYTATNALYFPDTRNGPNARRARAWVEEAELKLEELKERRKKSKDSREKKWLSKNILNYMRHIKKLKKENEKWLEGANDSLTIHEATHQLCYNSGLLTPSDINPEWVVEGLAVLFEEEGIWQGRHSEPNPMRVATLKRAAKQSQRMTVRDLVGTNQSLISRGDAGLAYASAWALIHLFVRGKFKKYKKPFLVYLEGIQKRSSEAGWEVQGGAAAAERLAHFEEAFGKVDELEEEYAEYLEKLVE
ncbi:MAG TPA: hypothetical protein DEA08_28155, partial [Planctomycetes bacterium]|nr:hypothetical protein [Planctomycetota bacterium]